jgi:hypothetical protein
MKITQELAAKTYDLAYPAMTTYGALNEELQRKALDHVVKQMNLIEAPNLQKIYDFSYVERARKQLEAQGWKP